MKKLISALMSLSLLAGVAAMPVSAAETYSLGDVDMNGVVDTRDAVLVLCEYVNVCLCPNETLAQYSLSDEQRVLANVYRFADEGEDVVSSADALTIMQYYLYTLLATDPVDADTFFADLGSIDYSEVTGADNYDEVSDQVLQEANDYYHDELH